MSECIGILIEADGEDTAAVEAAVAAQAREALWRHLGEARAFTARCGLVGDDVTEARVIVNGETRDMTFAEFEARYA